MQVSVTSRIQARTRFEAGDEGDLKLVPWAQNARLDTDLVGAVHLLFNLEVYAFFQGTTASHLGRDTFRVHRRRGQVVAGIDQDLVRDALQGGREVVLADGVDQRRSIDRVIGRLRAGVDLGEEPLVARSRDGRAAVGCVVVRAERAAAAGEEDRIDV